MSESIESEPIDYLERVERHFARRRGGPLVLSPRDWQLVKKWQDRGIPAEVVLRGINRAFDHFGAGPRRPDRINSLSYCKQHIEAAWLEHRELAAGEDGRSPSEPLAAAAEHLEMAAGACTSAAASLPAESGRAVLEAAAGLRDLAARAAAGQAGVREIDEAALELETATLDALDRAAAPGMATPALPRFSPWA